jgi:DNA end-binding protein Ku
VQYHLQPGKLADSVKAGANRRFFVAARAVWKGSIKLSLISIPIRVFPATSAASDVSFRQLHRKCHTPIQLRKWCPHCEQMVESADLVKGYETSKGHFVVVTEEEIGGLRPESTHVIDLSHILDAAAIDPIYIERSYFLAPDSKMAGPTFAVLRDALGDLAGIGRLALHGREYLVAVLPRDPGLVLYTLRTAGEVRDMSGMDTLAFADVKTRPDEVKLARQVLGALDHETRLSAFTDHYEEALRAMLASKTAVEVEAPGRAAPPKVVNLMDALRESLAHVHTKHRTPAARHTRTPARAASHPSRAGGAARRHRKAS